MTDTECIAYARMVLAEWRRIERDSEPNEMLRVFVGIFTDSIDAALDGNPVRLKAVLDDGKIRLMLAQS